MTNPSCHEPGILGPVPADDGTRTERYQRLDGIAVSCSAAVRWEGVCIVIVVNKPLIRIQTRQMGAMKFHRSP